MSKFKQYEIKLPPLGHLPPHKHVFDVESQWAIEGALGARRPLLVRGEPGTGKTQLARAAAAKLKRPLISQVVTAGMQSQELHWRFDAVARLARAQVLKVSDAPSDALSVLEERRFLQPGPLWWVLDWEFAERQWETCEVKGVRHHSPDKEWVPAQGCVLLIDEIDKAEADLPNGLLESLGNGEFHVPYLQHPVQAKLDHEPPLVVITTNEERELPRAFLRRCLVLNLSPDSNDVEGWLIERGRAHFENRCREELYQAAARMVAADRSSRKSSMSHRPGLAEFLDLLRAVLEMSSKYPGEDPAEILRRLSAFVLEKEATEG